MKKYKIVRTKYLLLFFSVGMISCHNPQKEKLLQRQTAIIKELQDITDSMSHADYRGYDNIFWKQQQRAKRLGKESDSLTTEIKKL